jgi:hypothetical protein
MSIQRPWWSAWTDLVPSYLNQPILPGWSFGNIEVNFAGDAGIEKEVVADVASYGKQLGILSEAVLALAGDHPAERQKRLDRLREIVAEIEAIKTKHTADLAANARDAMKALADNDPDAVTRIALEFAKGKRART